MALPAVMRMHHVTHTSHVAAMSHAVAPTGWYESCHTCRSCHAGSRAGLSGNMPLVLTVTRRMLLEKEKVVAFCHELLLLRDHGAVHRNFIGMGVCVCVLVRASVYTHITYIHMCVYI